MGPTSAGFQAKGVAVIRAPFPRLPIDDAIPQWLYTIRSQASGNGQPAEMPHRWGPRPGGPGCSNGQGRSRQSANGAARWRAHKAYPERRRSLHVPIEKTPKKRTVLRGGIKLLCTFLHIQRCCRSTFSPIAASAFRPCWPHLLYGCRCRGRPRLF